MELAKTVFNNIKSNKPKLANWAQMHNSYSISYKGGDSVLVPYNHFNDIPIIISSGNFINLSDQTEAVLTQLNLIFS